MPHPDIIHPTAAIAEMCRAVIQLFQSEEPMSPLEWCLDTKLDILFEGFNATLMQKQQVFRVLFGIPRHLPPKMYALMHELMVYCDLPCVTTYQRPE